MSLYSKLDKHVYKYLGRKTNKFQGLILAPRTESIGDRAKTILIQRGTVNILVG